MKGEENNKNPFAKSISAVNELNNHRLVSRGSINSFAYDGKDKIHSLIGMKQMQQNIRSVSSIITSNYCVKECLRPTINGYLAPWKILLLMIAGQKLILTSTKVLQLSKRPVFSECRRDSITSLNKPSFVPLIAGLFILWIFT